jgi:hypothetical protein
VAHLGQFGVAVRHVATVDAALVRSETTLMLRTGEGPGDAECIAQGPQEQVAQ